MTSGPHFDVAIPDVMNLASYFLDENIVKGRSDKTAIYYKDEQFTFKDVFTLTNKIGNTLKELGVRIEDRVLLVLQDCPEWIASWFAIMKIGGVCTHAYTYLQPTGYKDFVDLVRPKLIVVDDTTLGRVREGVKHSTYASRWDCWMRSLAIYRQLHRA
jgi:acyl-coenzyme A synthetase/AMP-(fatty) acid ligase